MICSKCGTNNINEASYCGKCGAPLQAKTPGSPSGFNIPSKVADYQYSAPNTGFYMFDFFITLVKKENIPLAIYLVLNIFIIGGFICAFCSLPIGWGILTGFLLYFGSVAIALSPIGELILRLQQRCYTIKDPEILYRIEPIFQEVYQKARSLNPTIPDDVRLFINKEESPNAFATGRRTICITKGLLYLPDDQIKSILGHEFGHLANKDTNRLLVVVVGNLIITAICVLVQLVIIFLDFTAKIAGAIHGGDEGFILACFSGLARLISLIIIQGLMGIWSKIGLILCQKTSRSNEYLADEFSYRLGYGDGLIQFLSSLHEERPTGLFATLERSHPVSQDRVSNLNGLRLIPTA